MEKVTLVFESKIEAFCLEQTLKLGRVRIGDERGVY